MDLDCDHSAHRVYLNSRTARDRLIVSNSFWFFFLFFYLWHFYFVEFKLKTIWFHHYYATINCWLIFPPLNLFPANSTTKMSTFTVLLYRKRSIGQAQTICPGITIGYLPHNWSTGQTTVNKWAPIRCIFPYNDIVLRPLLKCLKKINNNKIPQQGRPIS